VSEFTDLFVESLRQNKGKTKQMLEETDLEVDALKSKVDDYFKPREFGSEIPESVVAVDAGRNQVAFRNGLRMLVSRAKAYSPEQIPGRSMSVDFVRATSQDYREFRTATWQIREIDALIDSIERMNEGMALIDGSLLTRLRVMPNLLNINEERTRKFELINKMNKLLKRIEHKDVKLVGVSKDSETAVFGRQLIENYLEEESDASVNLSRLRQDQVYDLDAFADKAGLQGEKDILRLYSSRFTDNGLLSQLTETPGLSRPVRVGMINLRFRKETAKIKQQGPKQYIEEELELGDNTAKEPVQRALHSLLEFPSIRTVHWRPQKGDKPIRVDTLDYTKSLVDNKGVQFAERFDSGILKSLKAGYGGEAMHNVWISSADDSANLSNSEMENVFVPLVSKVLETDLQQYMKRRDRRA
jgi:hypothetical protein